MKNKRPKETGTLVGVRLQDDLLSPLDVLCLANDVGRPAAIRYILHEWFIENGHMPASSRPYIPMTEEDILRAAEVARAFEANKNKK